MEATKVLVPDNSVEWSTLGDEEPLTLAVLAGLLRSNNPANKIINWSCFVQAYKSVLDSCPPREWYVLFQILPRAAENRTDAMDAVAARQKQLMNVMLTKYIGENEVIMLDNFLAEKRRKGSRFSANRSTNLAVFKDELRQRFRTKFTSPVSRCIMGYIAVKLLESKANNADGTQDIGASIGELFVRLNKNFETKFSLFVQRFPGKLECLDEAVCSSRLDCAPSSSLQDSGNVSNHVPNTTRIDAKSANQIKAEVQHSRQKVSDWKHKIHQLEMALEESKNDLANETETLNKLSEQLKEAVERDGVAPSQAMSVILGQRDPEFFLQAVLGIAVRHKHNLLGHSELSRILNGLSSKVVLEVEKEQKYLRDGFTNQLLGEEQYLKDVVKDEPKVDIKVEPRINFVKAESPVLSPSCVSSGCEYDAPAVLHPPGEGYSPGGTNSRKIENLARFKRPRVYEMEDEGFQSKF